MQLLVSKPNGAMNLHDLPLSEAGIFMRDALGGPLEHVPGHCFNPPLPEFVAAYCREDGSKRDGVQVLGGLNVYGTLVFAKVTADAEFVGLDTGEVDYIIKYRTRGKGLLGNP